MLLKIDWIQKKFDQKSRSRSLRRRSAAVLIWKIMGGTFSSQSCQQTAERPPCSKSPDVLESDGLSLHRDLARFRVLGFGAVMVRTPLLNSATVSPSLIAFELR